MRHRLRRHAGYWRSFLRSSVVLSWILSGIPLLWLQGPPPPAIFPNHTSAVQHSAFVDQAIADLISTATALEVNEPPLVVSPLGVVPKPGSSKLRLIWDGRYVNSHLVCPQFKYETLADLPELLQPDDLLFSLDLKSGYHHCDMHEEFWQYLGFAWRGKYYVFTQLPFGLSIACWAFTKLMRQLLRKWRAAGHRCTGYIDDSLHAHQTATGLRHFQTTLVLPDLVKCGFILSQEKCELTPSTCKKYLGMMVNTSLRVLQVPDSKRTRFLTAVQDAQRGTRVHVKLLQHITGSLAAMSWAFGPIVRLYTRFLNAAISQARHPRDSVPLSAEALAELHFWEISFDQFNGHKQLWSPSFVHTIIHTDASGTNTFSFGGWGAWTTLNGDVAVAMGRWAPSESAGASSTLLELKGLYLALRSFNRSGTLAHQTVLIKTDNAAVAALVSRGGSQSADKMHLNDEVKDLFWYCIGAHITLLVEWIPREDNQQADLLSKFIDVDDWKVTPGSSST
jgi:hypothetical protein